MHVHLVYKRTLCWYCALKGHSDSCSSRWFNFREAETTEEIDLPTEVGLSHSCKAAQERKDLMCDYFHKLFGLPPNVSWVNSCATNLDLRNMWCAQGTQKETLLEMLFDARLQRHQQLSRGLTSRTATSCVVVTLKLLCNFLWLMHNTAVCSNNYAQLLLFFLHKQSIEKLCCFFSR